MVFVVGMTNLQLLERKPTTGSDAAVVPDGRAAHDRSELVDGTRGEFRGLLETVSTAAGFASRLPKTLDYLFWKES